MCAKKRSTKDRILDMSLDLFNQDSWSNTSIRGIASSLQMSDGNLRYHFKTKEEIVLKLVHRMTAELQGTIPVGVLSPDDLKQTFQSIFRVMYGYRFLFLESVFILKAYPSYALLFKELERSRKILFSGLIDGMRKNDLFSAVYSEEQYKALNEQLFIVADNWMKYIDIELDEDQLDLAIQSSSELAFKLLTPYWKSF